MHREETTRKKSKRRICFSFCGSVDTMRKLVVYFPSSCCLRLGGTSGFAHRYQSIHSLHTSVIYRPRCYFKKTRNTDAKWVSAMITLRKCARGMSSAGGDLRPFARMFVLLPMMKATFRVENIVGVPLTHFDAVDNFPSRFLINHRGAECKLHRHGGSNDE